MLIDRMAVSGFRGVREPVTLDLRAPVTLVYAPNGVGKTSLCDAAEWVLTGAVRRLQGGSVKNWFRAVSDEDVLVEVSGALAGSATHWGRTARGELKARAGGKWIREDEAAAMRRLVGAEVAGASSQARRAFAQEFIRSARFLDSEDVALLLDSDGRDARANAFAGLFGVDRYARQRTDLSRILQDLSPAFVDGEFRQLERDLAQKKAAATFGAAQDYAALREDLLERLAAAERELGLNEGGAQLAKGRADRIGSALEERRRRLTTRTEALDLLRQHWNECPHWVRRASEVNTELAASAAVQAKLEQSLREKIERSSLVGAESERLAAVLAGAKARLEQVSGAEHEFRGSIEEWDRHGGGVLPKLEEVERARASARVDAKRAADRGRALQACWERLEEWEAAQRRLVQLPSDRARLEGERNALPPVSEIDAAIARTNEFIAGAKARVAEIAGPFARFQSQAAEVIAHLGNDPHCPLCGHDHQSIGALREAIRLAMATEPQVVVETAKAIEPLAHHAAEFQEKRRRRVLLDERLATLEAERAELEKALAEAHLLLRAAGIDKVEPAQLRPMVAREISDAQASLRAVIAQEEHATRVLDLVRRIREVAAVVARTLGREGEGSTDLLAVPPATWPAHVGAARDQIAVDLEKGAHALRAAELERDALVGEIETLTSKRQANVAAKVRLEEERYRVQGDLDAFNSAAQLLKVDGQRLDLLDEAARSVAEDRSFLQEWEERTQGLGEKIEEVRVRLSAVEKLEALQTQLNRARRVRDERARWKAEIEEAIRVLEEHQMKRIEAQTEPLRRIVSAMYARSQAHEVVQAVDIRAAQAGGWDWIAYVRGKPVGELQHLSRGQRQDLAIAIFLARTVSMGGSVFLDEPFLHLDDLNRAGALDTLRVIALEHGDKLRIVITTASRVLVRHLREKFSLLAGDKREPLLRILTLDGAPFSRVSVDHEEVVRGAAHDEVRLVPGVGETSSSIH